MKHCMQCSKCFTRSRARAIALRTMFACGSATSPMPAYRPLFHALDWFQMFLKWWPSLLTHAGKWNSHCDIVRCDAEGEALVDVEPRRVWTNNEKPKGDYYGCVLSLCCL